MAEKLSIRYRIGEQVRLLISRIEDIAVAELWDARGNSESHLSAVVYSEAEQAVEGGQGGTGLTTNRMTIRVEVLIAQDPDERESSTRIAERWIARVKESLLSNRFLIEEETGEQLANDTRYLGCDPPEDSRQGTFVIAPEFEIEYDETRDDPYTGPGVTERTE